MAVLHMFAGSIRNALLTPQQSKPVRCWWIVRGRKRSWNALRQSKTPQPQYRPPFHPFDAHAHGSAACRGACMLRCLDSSQVCIPANGGTHTAAAHTFARVRRHCTRAEPRTHTRARSHAHRGTACVQALHTHGAPATPADVCACACASACVPLCVCGSENDRRLSAAFQFR